MKPKTEAEQYRAELMRKIDDKNLELKRLYKETSKIERDVAELEDQLEASWVNEH